MKLLEDLEYVSVAETKAKLSEKLKGVESRGRRFAITSHGKPKAVVISYNEYLSLIKKSPSAEPEEMSLGKLKREMDKKKGVIDSVASLFDETKFTRKGQKRYKRETVRKMEKTAG